MKTPEELKKAILEIIRICEKRKTCKGCPFWDDDLECRLRNPTSWWTADWKEKAKNENA